MYIVAKYIRLSQQDAGSGESNSVKNQRAMLDRYIAEKQELAQGCILEFVDDGYSGTSFERPGIKKLLELVERDMLDCIVVKDFSRFARDYIEAGRYLEVEFPRHGVRFIAVNDGFDSLHSGVDESLGVCLKNIMADIYSKELSLKVTNAKERMMERGEHTAPYALYGYRKERGERALRIDEAAAQVVRRIYGMSLDGLPATVIAARLNSEGIPSPLAYKRRAGCANKGWRAINDNCFWYPAAVRNILADRRYTGAMVCGKSRRAQIGKREQMLMPPERWYITENKHEPIIPSEVFAAVQAGRRTGIQTETAASAPLSGKVICAQCGHSLRRRQLKDGAFYRCSTTALVKKSGCFSGALPEDTLEAVVLTLLNIALAVLYGNKLPKSAAAKPGAALARCGEQSRCRRLAEQQSRKRKAYERYRRGESTREELERTLMQCAETVKQLTDSRQAAERPEDVVEDVLFIDTQGNAVRFASLSRDITDRVLRRLLVTPQGELIIEWAFADNPLWQSSH